MAQLVPVETFDLVIFGGTGDLAMRKLRWSKKRCAAVSPMVNLMRRPGGPSQLVSIMRRPMLTNTISGDNLSNY
jgi:hypothetical protein